MPQKIIDSVTDITGRQVRVYAARRYWRTAGRWRAIDEDLSVEAGDDGSYTVRLGDAAIRLAPVTEGDRKALATATKRRVTTRRRFGPILDAKGLPKALRFELVTEGDVVDTPAGPAFAADDDRALGCFFRKWTDRLGGRMRRDQYGRPSRGPRPTIITLDLDGFFDEGVGPDAELDLDPETISPEEPKFTSQKVSVNSTSIQDAWDTVRAASVANNQDYNFVHVRNETADDNPEPDKYSATIHRAAFRFDTTGYDAASAKLVLPDELFEAADGASVHMSRVKAWTGANWYSYESYGDIKANGFDVPANRIGYVSDTGTTWESPDLVASGHYAESATLDLALYEEHDLNDNVPAANAIHAIVWSNVGVYLEITLAGQTERSVHSLISGGQLTTAGLTTGGRL